MEEKESCKFEKAVGLEGPIFALVHFGISDILAPRNGARDDPSSDTDLLNRWETSAANSLTECLLKHVTSARIQIRWCIHWICIVDFSWKALFMS